ncbi:PREDICTED: probable ATP-dependent RNA helicase DDX46 [Priapulus caudatus]|uniref:Probable ATP-dependent RNA helicase DDX46 n=1 Tax=Priapulus caudatus TaxID=37621 RepID=A0ABM1EDN3_PRICU|nr:PREDICTED: probable ATP-dependent RNA helicase DDX46 [Priapulus caudatus]
MADRIHAKLNYTKTEEKPEAEEQTETLKRYELELEINDFPQTCRWRVTSKEALEQICEYSEAGITVRGTYCLPNKDPPAAERKLYLAIESTNERSLAVAKAEVTRLIKEELVRLQNSYQYQPAQKNRYKVL